MKILPMEEQAGISEPVKCMLVGDDGVGKTCMVITHIRNEFPNGRIPTISDNVNTSVIFDGKQVELCLWDSAATGDWNRLRLLSYPQTRVFLIVFSLVSPASLANVEAKWAKELQQHRSGIPIILVGTKADLVTENSASEQTQRVSSAQGQAVAKRIGAIKYMECSALTQEGIADVFKEAGRVGLVKKSCACVVS